ncbi:methyl-accepting chemotaxis protein [Brevundimonas sp. NIBR10]|uniref:methyl-accepting chemotaxis protein n=1 Tax=Brevundimonas sp. NIBR10 TaxID=3015997 RepID=UPI0022F19219|nr:methyl-accepting chemotaxis protein [Brevundimonas sp. NIBR10]
MKIRAQLAWGFGGVLLMSVVVGVVAIEQVAQIEANLTTINDVNSVKQRYAINFRGSVHDRAISLRDVTLVSTAAEMDAAVESIETLAAAYAASAGPLDAMMTGEGVTSDEAAILASIKETEARTNPMVERVVALQAAGDADGAKRLLMEEARPAFVEWLARINQFIDLQEARNKAIGAETRETASHFTWLIVGLCGLGLLIGAAIAFWATRAIAPLNRLTVVMQDMAKGELSQIVPSRERGDEVGAIANAVEVLRQSSLEAAVLKQEAHGFQTELDRRLKSKEVEFENATHTQAAVAAALAEGLSHLSQGDLTYRIADTLPAEAAQVRSDFNATVANLQETISEVVNNVSAIRSGSGEISQAADDLSRRTEQQAASLEETAAALDEITATVNRTASGARQASDTVQAAKGDAETSGKVVRDAVSAMGAIEKSAQEISQIIGVIDEIAFQTNLLALNAGVEAARAGDAGRGFAVVASEVRALAQRSAEAAKEIKVLISASTSQVNTGVNLVGQTGEALQRIVSRVAEIDGLVSEIAASAQEQATGLQQVNTAVNQMDQVTQQNAAMVEQSTAASHSLSQEAESLAQSVSRFQIGSAAPQATRSAPRAAPRPAAHRPAAPAQRPVAALRTTGHGGAARRPEPVAAADGWEEF